MNINDICKPKNRGRPKKSFAFIKTKSTSQIIPKNHQEELILHLPITTNDIKNKNCNQFTANEETTVQETKQFATFTDMSDDDDNKIKEKKNNKNDKIIDQLKLENQELKNKINSSKISINHVIDLNRFIEHNNLNVKSNLPCWWCTYEFTENPCYIPEKYYNEKYYVFGNFCSYNCAAAYNISMNDYKVWDRFSLINKLYNQVTNNNNIINIAPPKEILIKYGGDLTITEYREKLNQNNKEYRFIIPPIEYIKPQIEEKTRQDKSDLFIQNGKLRLQRTNPLPQRVNTDLNSKRILFS